MVKTFVDIYGPSGECLIGEFMVFEDYGRFVPPIGCPFSLDPGIAVLVGPLGDPWLEGEESGGGPAAVEVREDEEDAVGHGVGEVVGVFGEV